jgi:hypothetical protein
MPGYKIASLRVSESENTAVTCVLSGMQGPNYVDDSLGALRSPAFDVDLHLYEAFAHM